MKLSELLTYFVRWGQKKYSRKTIAIYKGHIKQFIRFVDDKSIEDIRLLEDIIGYTEYLEQQNTKGNTIALSMTSIRQLWRMAESLERQLKIQVPFLVHMIPVQYNVHEQSHKPITEQDFQKLLYTITSSRDQDAFTRLRDETMFRLLYDTGMRVSELTSLDVSSIIAERNSINVVTKKRRDALNIREVYFTHDTTRVLHRYLAARGKNTHTEALFFGLKKDSHRISSRSVQRIFKAYCRQAKLDSDNLSPHSFRHGLGMRAAENQMYQPLLQMLLGHRTPNSSQVYYNLRNESLRKEYHAKLGNYQQKARNLFKELQPLQKVA